MTVKVAILEKDGEEYNVPTEMDMTAAIYNSGLTYYATSSITDVTTSSTSFTQDSALNITPVAGTYLAILNVETSQVVLGVNNRGEIALYLGGAQVTNSLREFGFNMSGISLASAAVASANSSITVITVNGSQVVTLGYRVAQGSNLTIHNRTLTLLRIK